MSIRQLNPLQTILITLQCNQQFINHKWFNHTIWKGFFLESINDLELNEFRLTLFPILCKKDTDRKTSPHILFVSTNHSVNLLRVVKCCPANFYQTAFFIVFGCEQIPFQMFKIFWMIANVFTNTQRREGAAKSKQTKPLYKYANQDIRRNFDIVNNRTDNAHIID